MTDSTWRWVTPRSVLAGSPLNLFTLSEAGAEVARTIEAGDEPLPSSLVDRLLDAGAIHPRITATTATFDDVSVVTPQLGGVVAADGRITVDDGSDPPLAGAPVRLEVNVGPAGARNAGRRLVASPFIAFVDADVELPELDPSHPGHERWWATVLGHFADDRVALVAPRVAGDPDSSLDLGAEPARIRAGTRVGYVPAAAVVVRSAALDDVGGFDATLRAGEDVDLVWRLDAAGWRCRYEPAVVVGHRPRATWRGRLAQQVTYGSSSGPLSLRHPGMLAPWRGSGAMAASWLLVAAGRPLVGAAVAAASLGRFVRRAGGLDAKTALALAGRGHLAMLRQTAAAVRRAWWPLLVPLLWSRRARRIMALSFLVRPRRAALDVAFSVGLWRSVIATRDAGALRPRRSGTAT